MSHSLSSTSQFLLPPVQTGQVLSREEAKSRIQKLVPDSPEHRSLQSALIKAAGVVEINLPDDNTYKVNTCSDECALLGGFGASEHVAIGEAVELKGVPKDAALIIKGPNKVQFKHVIALAGDFYGVVGESISLPGGTDEEKTARFQKAFDTLKNANNNELRQVLLEIDRECMAVRYSSLPHHCYSSNLMDGNNAMKQIKSDVGELLIDNSDHFSKDAKEAYRIGHALAISVAREAGRLRQKNNLAVVPQGSSLEPDLDKLKEAYALDAFACHFLTDLFASGHIRNQRGELETFFISQMHFGSWEAKRLAGLLTAAQHEKDGKDGLNVQDGCGNHWRAFGDGCFFTSKNEENKQMVIAATQASANEVYDAYLNPDNLVSSKMEKLIPHATAANPPPVYSVQGTSLFLHRGIHAITIQAVSMSSLSAQVSCVNKCIAQALRFLPEDHVIKFVQGYMPQIDPSSTTDQLVIPKVIADVVIIAPVKYLLDSTWSMIGLATYRQVGKANQQLNDKMDEMADTVKSTHENTLKLLQESEKANAKLDFIQWDLLSREIWDAVRDIKDATHAYFITKLSEDETQKSADKLFAAYNTMSRIFKEGTANGQEIVLAYKALIIKSNRSMSEPEVTIQTTIWLKQMLSYQAQAFYLYMTLKKGLTAEEAQSKIIGFEKSLPEQIELNRDHIDVSFICAPLDYINLQLGKIKVRQEALSYLAQLRIE